MWNFSDLNDLAKKAQEFQTTTGGMFNLDNMMGEEQGNKNSAPPPQPPAATTPSQKTTKDPSTTTYFSTPSPSDLFSSAAANTSLDTGKLFNSITGASLDKREPSRPPQEEEPEEEEEEWDFDEEDLQVEDDNAVPQQTPLQANTDMPLFRDQPAVVESVFDVNNDINDDANDGNGNNYDDEFDFGTDDEEEEEQANSQQPQPMANLPLSEVSFGKNESRNDPYTIKEPAVHDPFALNESELITTMRTEPEPAVSLPAKSQPIESDFAAQMGAPPERKPQADDPFAINETEQLKQPQASGFATFTEREIDKLKNDIFTDMAAPTDKHLEAFEMNIQSPQMPVHDTVLSIEKEASAVLNLASTEKETNLSSEAAKAIVNEWNDDDENLDFEESASELENKSMPVAEVSAPATKVGEDDEQQELSRGENDVTSDIDDMYDDVDDMYDEDDDDDSSSDENSSAPVAPKGNNDAIDSDDATPITGVKNKIVEQRVDYYERKAFKRDEQKKMDGDEGIVAGAAAAIDGASRGQKSEDATSAFSFSKFSSTLGSSSSAAASSSTEKSENKREDINAESINIREANVSSTNDTSQEKKKEEDNSNFSFSTFSSTLGSLQSQAAKQLEQQQGQASSFSFSKFSSSLGPLTSPSATTSENVENAETSHLDQEKKETPLKQPSEYTVAEIPSQTEDNVIEDTENRSLPAANNKPKYETVAESTVEKDSNNQLPDTKPEKDTDESLISSSVLDKYTDQMQRLAEHHSTELAELEKKHASDMQQAQEMFSEQIKQYEQQMQERNNEWEDLLRSKEGMSLKVDMLKRELYGTQQLLKERDDKLSSIESIHGKTKKLLEEQMKEIQENAGTAKADVYQVQSQLKMKNIELEEAAENYAALKARVKVVATELKERRSECRNLGVANNELNDLREQLEAQVATLTSQLDDRNRSNDETITELDDLREQVKVLQQEVKEAEGKIQLKSACGDQALSAYKKKAQNSLAEANARTAAAVQAQEEAELEARAARQTSDEAVERAREAEAVSNSKMEEAKEYVKEMEGSVATFQAKADDDASQISSLKSELDTAKNDVEALSSSKYSLEKEVATKTLMYEELKSKSTELETENANLQQRSNNLYDEVETLREELRKSAAKAFMAQTDRNAAGTESSRNGGNASATGHFVDQQKSESESTILMLQRELKDSNMAIKELKETLQLQLEGSMKKQNQDSSRNNSPMRANIASPTQSKGNDSTPLFYAMEKQAELSQAHEEINRLATLLGDLESEKMNAFDQLENMKRERDLAEARLTRFQKLGGASSTSNLAAAGNSNFNTGQQNHQPTSRRQQAVKDRLRYLQGASQADSLSMNSWGSGDDLMPTDLGGSSVGGPIDPNQQDAPAVNSGADANVNLEYLKNVMLSYLKAKTYNERKRLVPALSAVLCLTPEESMAAMKSVEESGSVESVGMSLFENLGTRAGLKLL